MKTEGVESNSTEHNTDACGGTWGEISPSPPLLSLQSVKNQKNDLGKINECFSVG